MRMTRTATTAPIMPRFIYCSLIQIALGRYDRRSRQICCDTADFVGGFAAVVQAGTAPRAEFLGSCRRPQQGKACSEHDAVHDETKNIGLKMQHERLGDEGPEHQR